MMGPEEKVGVCAAMQERLEDYLIEQGLQVALPPRRRPKRRCGARGWRLWECFSCWY